MDSTSSNLFGRSEPSERLYTVLLHLSGGVRSRLRRFMNRQEFIGMRPSDIIGTLLDREEVFPGNTHSYAAAKKRRNRSPSFQAQLTQHESTQIHVAYPFDNVTQMAAGGKSIPYHLNRIEEGEAIDDDYGGDFAEEGEIMDEEEHLILNDGYGNVAGTSGGRGRSEFRNQMGQRLEYYSTHDRIAEPRSDGFMSRLKLKKTVPGSKIQYKLGVSSAGQRQWTSALRRHWYGLVVKYQRSGLLHCRLCDTCMDVVVRGVGLRAGNAFDHVCKHLGKPVFVCRICEQQTVLSIEMRDHIRSAHQADTRTFVDFLDIYSGELEQMIVYCFEPSVDNGVSTVSSMGASTLIKDERLQLEKKRKKVTKRKHAPTVSEIEPEPSEYSHLTARQFCYHMILKWQRNNALYCRECDQWLRVGAKNNWLRSETAMQHICGHLGKPLYKCRLCPQSTATSRQIRQHLQTVHKSGIRGQYIDLTESLQEDLKHIAAGCFDWTDTEGGPPINEGRFLRPRIRTDLQSNVGRREALLLCRRLIHSCVVNGRMQCHLCGTAFVAMTANGYPLAETVYNHSLKHLDPPPYSCRVCSKRTHNSANMRSHIWSKHKDMALTEFVDYTSQMQADIMTCLNQCFYSDVIVGNEIIEQNVDESIVIVGQPEAILGSVVSTHEGIVILAQEQPSSMEQCYDADEASTKGVADLSQG